jgi:hypothetical protein
MASAPLHHRPRIASDLVQSELRKNAGAVESVENQRQVSHFPTAPNLPLPNQKDGDRAIALCRPS